MSDVGGKYGRRRLNRSAGPQDVRPGWLSDSAERSIGPYIDYGNSVADRRTGEVIWREGDDPAKRPANPPREPYDKPRTVRRGL